MNRDWSYYPTALEVETEIGVCAKRKVSCEPRLKLLSNSSRGWGWDLDPLNFFDPCETDKGLNYFFPSRSRLRISCQFFFWYIRDWDCSKFCDQKKVETETTLIHGKMPKLPWDHVLRSWIEAENCTFSLKIAHFWPFLSIFCLPSALNVLLTKTKILNETEIFQISTTPWYRSRSRLSLE